jgi:hypothetical protein
VARKFLFHRQLRSQFKTSSRHQHGVDHFADGDAAFVEIDGRVIARQIDDEWNIGMYDELLLAGLEHTALDDFRGAEDGGDKIAAAGDGVDLAGFGFDGAVYKFADGAIVGSGQIKFISRSGGDKYDEAVLNGFDLSSGQKIGFAHVRQDNGRVGNLPIGRLIQNSFSISRRRSDKD